MDGLIELIKHGILESDIIGLLSKESNTYFLGDEIMSYQVRGAIVNDQGVKFAIVTVKHNIVTDISENTEALNAYRHIFPDMPIILLGRDLEGKSAYYGPGEIVNFLATVDPQRIPWRHYIIT